MGVSGPVKRINRVSIFRKPYIPFRLFQNLFDFVYPRICLLCERGHDDQAPLCSCCLKKLHDSSSVKIQSGPVDFHHLSATLFFNRAVTCWDFNPELENLIHQVKYQGRRKLGQFLGKMAGRAAMDTCPDITANSILIPIPLHRVRLRERGFNQSEWIVKGISESTAVAVDLHIIKRKKQTRTQTRLTATEREKNVFNAFEVCRPEAVHGRTVILVDDVITTGATLNACARVLKESGAESVVGLALARPIAKFL